MGSGRFALIVATDTYGDPDFSRLTAPRQDAETLAEVLSHAEIGAFEVTTLVNAEAHIIRREIEDFFHERKRDDTLLLYFSGHGIKDLEGHLHFVASDTSRKLLQATSVAAAFINDVMRRSRSRQQILLIDSCYSGAFAHGLVVKGDDEVQVGEAFSQGRGRAVITASDAMQYAFEGDELKGSSPGSVFTRHLIQGLRSGEADQDHDGWISLDEMYDYIHERVTLEMPEQVPRKWVFDVEGNMIVARNANPSAVDLPSDIKEALADHRVFVREGAVGKLGTLLDSDHPGLVKAARLALRRVGEEDDSRSVSRIAARLLREHEVTPPLDSMPPDKQRAKPGGAIPASEVTQAPHPEPKAAAPVVEEALRGEKSLDMSAALLVAIQAFIWVIVGGSGIALCDYLLREYGFFATVVDDYPYRGDLRSAIWSGYYDWAVVLIVPAIGGFCGLCSGWGSGAVAKRLVRNPSDTAVMRLSLDLNTTFAIMSTVVWSTMLTGYLINYWYATGHESSIALLALGAGGLWLLAGLTMAPALASLGRSHWNTRWLALYAAGWAAAFLLDSAVSFWAHAQDIGFSATVQTFEKFSVQIFGVFWSVTMIVKLNKSRTL